MLLILCVLSSLKSYAQRVVRAILEEQTEGDIERVLVSGAVVHRDGDHYRIESGGDEWSDLQSAADRAAGRCDCGKVLSRRGDRWQCRTCGRQYRAG